MQANNRAYPVSEYNKNTKRIYPPSIIYANTLFTFATELRFIEPWIRRKAISARYCVEDISYLRIGIDRIAFPMKCFCDINIHMLGEHVQWYGYYGIGLSKEWGMRNGVQPIQYVNKSSYLARDFRVAFKQAEADNISSNKKLRNYIGTQLAFLKPCYGSIRNRNSNRRRKKSFTDESEWRFVPKVSSLGLDQFIIEKSELSDVVLNRFSNAIDGKPESSVSFDYTDIKYIIVRDKESLHDLIQSIKTMKITDDDTDYIISKIMIWDEIKEDF